MKINTIKIDLIKLDGTNVLFGNGYFDLSKEIITERNGILKKDISKYSPCKAEHIKGKINIKKFSKRTSSKPYIFIDVKGSRSIDPILTKKIDLKTKVELDYLIESAIWKASMETLKESWKMTLLKMFAGFGICLFILLILRSIGIGLDLIL